MPSFKNVPTVFTQHFCHHLFPAIISRRYSMQKFVTHESISIGYFNRDYSGGTGVLAAWSAELRNTPKILDLLIQRMHTDFERLTPRMRKPYGPKDVVSRNDLRPCFLPNPT